jgi:hypothetical protein
MKFLLKEKICVAAKILLSVASLTIIFTACTAIQIGGDFILNNDGSGSRKLILHLYDQDGNDGYGSAYKYSRLHGDALKTKIEETLAAKLGDSSWLTVSVRKGTGAEADTEFITLAFNFSNFDDYADKMTRLAMFGGKNLPDGSRFIPPVLTGMDDIYRYKESTNTTLWAVRPLFLALFDDQAVFDFTAGGTNTKASLDDLRNYGIEMKSVGITLVLGANSPRLVTSGEDINELFSMSGQQVDWMREDTELVLHYDFDENIKNKGGNGATADLTLGNGSSMSKVTYADGISGKGLHLDGATYLKTPASYAFSELTVSFYFKAEEFLETDTGAGMVLVCSGLGALSPGALDVEFWMDKNDDLKPVMFISKTNGANWMNQDKMETETFFNNRLQEWHHFAVVYENEYDRDGEYDVSYITLYIDGIQYSRMEQYQAAGLDKQVGVESNDEAVSASGFNIGGYYENEAIKRGIKGVLDEFRIYSGPLTQSEIEELYNANPVKLVYDPDDVSNTDPSVVKKTSSQSIRLVIIILGVLLCAGLVLFGIKRKKRS